MARLRRGFAALDAPESRRHLQSTGDASLIVARSGGVKDCGQPAAELADEYALALQHFLSEPGEAALVRAHELGRKALARGLGVLDMAAVQSRGLKTVLNGSLADDQRATVLDAIEAFSVEALSSFEMAHRGYWEAHRALHRLNDTLEDQAKRIGSTLHHEVGQFLACLHFALAALAPKLAPHDVEEIHAARGMLDEIEQRLRNIAHELRPPILDHRGLVPALEFLGDGVSKRWGLAVSVQASVEPHLPATLESTLYRITQEALTNVVKHAKATRASVIVQQAADQIACSICDDGIGFAAVAPAAENGSGGLGLIEIEERVTALGGSVRLGSNTPYGAALRVEIPFKP